MKYGPRKSNNTPAKSAGNRKRKTKSKTSMTKQDVIQLIDKGREIKRAWGIQSESANLLAVPSGALVSQVVIGEGANAYSATALNRTKQGLENENRIGNIVKPVRFTYKGYGYIEDNTTTSTTVQQTHVRVVAGFRRQSSILSTSQSNLQMEGGKTVELSNSYTAILNDFNWKEFRPFYDKTFQIAPSSATSQNFTNPYLKNYFQFNIDYKFSPTADNLVSLEDQAGGTDELYNNNNIYVLFIARQMNNGVTTDPLSCRIWATSLFQFTDA
jgi:hypothetical protein